MISILQNEVERLRPASNELAMDIEAFLNSGGTIQVLETPPEKPRVRYEQPPTIKTPKPTQAKTEPGSAFVDKMTLREIERAERRALAAQDRAKLVEQVKKLAATMTYSEVSERTSLSRRMLYSMSKQHNFQFKAAAYRNGADKKRGSVDEKHDANTAERIKTFKEIGLTRNQAINQLGITFKTFNRLLEKFGIDYPKLVRRASICAA